MDAKKIALIDVMKSNFGNITMACDSAGISRQTFYNWKEDDANFKEIVENIDEYLVDFAEHSLFKQIREGNTPATIFYLKTKGRTRGYIEKQEIDHRSGDGSMSTQPTKIVFTRGSKGDGGSSERDSKD